MKTKLAPLTLAVFALAGIAPLLAVDTGLKVKVEKKVSTTKAADTTEQMHLEINVENAGKNSYKDTEVVWTMVLDKAPEKPGKPSKLDFISDTRKGSLIPQDIMTVVTAPERQVSKKVGFMGGINKWFPKYHGYGVKVISDGKVIFSAYSNQNLQKEIEEYEAQKPPAK